MDMLGDLGGVAEAIFMVFGLIFYPISKFSFTLKATQKLYLAKTEDK